MPAKPLETPEAPPAGRIDIHSHLLPGVDDGCQTFAESLHSVRRLKEMGYAGTICTPHIWPDLYPLNVPENIATWVEALRASLQEAGEDYRLWAGGELRVFDGVIDWMKAHGVPTLAGSNCVLCDFWETKWPRWMDRYFDHLLAEGYQPILAHPERLAIRKGLAQKLEEWASRGVLLQGNTRCITGDEGPDPQAQMQAWLAEERYTFFALDMHRPNTLESRLSGIPQLIEATSAEKVDDAIVHAPRRIIFGRGTRRGQHAGAPGDA